MSGISGPSRQTVVRAVEAFLVVFVTGLASEVTISGTPLDLGTHAGQAAALTAILSALALAFRRALAVSAGQPAADPPAEVG